MTVGTVNLGNAKSTVLGGAVIAGGFGFPAIALAGAATAVAGLIAVVVASRRTKDFGSRASDPVPV